MRRGGILTVKNWLWRQQLGVALLALSEARLLRESVAKAIGIRRGLAEDLRQVISAIRASGSDGPARRFVF